jgi:hypothetical protein
MVKNICQKVTQQLHLTNKVYKIKLVESRAGLQIPRALKEYCGAGYKSTMVATPSPTVLPWLKRTLF